MNVQDKQSYDHCKHAITEANETARLKRLTFLGVHLMPPSRLRRSAVIGAAAGTHMNLNGMACW